MAPPDAGVEPPQHDFRELANRLRSLSREEVRKDPELLSLDPDEMQQLIEEVERSGRERDRRAREDEERRVEAGEEALIRCAKNPDHIGTLGDFFMVGDGPWVCPRCRTYADDIAEVEQALASQERAEKHHRVQANALKRKLRVLYEREMRSEALDDIPTAEDES